jgi:hypothetical protein
MTGMRAGLPKDIFHHAGQPSLDSTPSPDFSPLFTTRQKKFTTFHHSPEKFTTFHHSPEKVHHFSPTRQNHACHPLGIRFC